MLGIIFDQVWACVEPELAKYFYRVEDPHIRLATIILKLGADGQLGRHQIAATASRLIRQARPHDNDR
jgi:hypothetical protein